MKEIQNKEIKDILTRSIANILPSREALEKELLSGKKLRIYMGADPTGPKLHIGHATNLILLERLRRFGHQVIVLFGDFTALIGDPSDKEAARRRLTEEEVRGNMRTWKKQAGRILNFTDKKNPAKILKNSTWLSKITFEKLVEISSHFTVQQMIERDMFERRIRDRKPIYLHEFFYPLMQGYDSVHMNVDVEIGGTDQTFNMLMGRTLRKIYNNKDKFIIATTLLENPTTGRKLMSKSEGTYIGIDDSPHDMFGKAMALPDETIIQVFTDCTGVSLDAIEKFKTDLFNGANPRDVKLALAYELVKTYHGEKEAKRARKDFITTFQKENFPKDAQEIIVKEGTDLLAILLKNGFVESKSDFRRLLNEGALRNIKTGKKIDKSDFKIIEDLPLRIGKKRFIRIKIQNT